MAVHESEGQQSVSGLFNSWQLFIAHICRHLLRPVRDHSPKSRFSLSCYSALSHVLYTPWPIYNVKSCSGKRYSIASKSYHISKCRRSMRLWLFCSCCYYYYIIFIYLTKAVVLAETISMHAVCTDK